MKDYKLLLMGLVLLLLIILIGVLSWMWLHNRKNINPLPIMADPDSSSEATGASGDKETMAANVLYIQAEEQLQVPLDNVIVRFEARYPNVQVLAHYVTTSALLTLPDARTDVTKTKAKPQDDAPFVTTIDLLIADGTLSQSRLAPLQAKLDEAKVATNDSRINANGMMQEPARTDDSSPQDDNSEARTLSSFGYAIKDTQTVEGVILTDNPLAVSFRNFLLSSAGQDILKQYDYSNIDGYKNSVDDLFNPTSRAKPAANEDAIQVADALTNGK